MPRHNRGRGRGIVRPPSQPVIEFTGRLRSSSRSSSPSTSGSDFVSVPETMANEKYEKNLSELNEFILKLTKSVSNLETSSKVILKGEFSMKMKRNIHGQEISH